MATAHWFIRSAIDGPLGHFHLLMMVNDPAVSAAAQTSRRAPAFTSFGRRLRAELPNHLLILSLTLEEQPSHFPQRLLHLHSHSCRFLTQSPETLEGPAPAPSPLLFPLPLPPGWAGGGDGKRRGGSLWDALSWLRRHLLMEPRVPGLQALPAPGMSGRVPAKQQRVLGSQAPLPP